MKTTRCINFDMDGTIADFYNVSGWLDKIRAFDTSPYEEAKGIGPLNQIARQLNRLQRQGYTLRVLSWCSKESTPDFDERTAIAKKEWLQKHMPSVSWDDIVIAPYGVNKSSMGRKLGGILFDDNEQVRADWKGTAFSEKQILDILKNLGR